MHNFKERLRSSSSNHLAMLRICLCTVGKQVFQVSGATVWNDLPPHVTSAPSLMTFRQRLKSFLFSQSYRTFTPDSQRLHLCGPSNNWHYLGHTKNYDDDDVSVVSAQHNLPSSGSDILSGSLSLSSKWTLERFAVLLATDNFFLFDVLLAAH